MALREKNFDVARYRHENLLLKVNQSDEFEILLRNISDALVISPAQPFCTYGFDHAIKAPFVKSATTTNRSGACVDSSSATPLVLDEAAFVALLG